MMRSLVCLAVLATAVFAEHDVDVDDVYSGAIGEPVDNWNVKYGTDAISRFLGFKCPKGYRCLPVLECLPCDYGTYKSNEGSDLCQNCPAGCTTLRKGAKSWKECVPKCPPGFEESKCGKTCTKCRPGFFKNNWKNKKCKKCPMNSNWARNMVGMKKKSQCYKQTEPKMPECHSYTGDIILALDASEFVSEEDFIEQLVAVNYFIEAFDVTPDDDATRFAVFTFCTEIGDVIDFDDYATKTELQNKVNGLRWMGGRPTNISLALDYINHHLSNSPENRYDVPDTAIVVVQSGSASPEQTASSAASLKTVMDKVFAVGIGNVDIYEISEIASHESYSVTADSTESLESSLPVLTKDACELLKAEPEDPISEPTPTSSSPAPGEGRCYDQHGPCILNEYEDIRLVALHGTNCQRFCQCAHASTTESGSVTYKWVEHPCASGTLFNETLPGCDHEYAVTCTDSGPSTTAKPVTSWTSGVTESPDPGPSTTTTAGGTESPENEGCVPSEACTEDDYNVDRQTLLHGSGCNLFCQCVKDGGFNGLPVSYYWQVQACEQGELFDVSLPGCNNENYVSCDDASSSGTTSGGAETTTYSPDEETTTYDPNEETTTQATTGTTYPADDMCNLTYGICNQTDHDDTRLLPLNGVDCRKFCQCATASTSSEGTVTYYWEEQWCAPGTIFVSSLGTFGVCAGEDQYSCEDDEFQR